MSPTRPRKVPLGFTLLLCSAFLFLIAPLARATATADVEVTKSNDTGGTLAAGGVVTYTITVTNHGPSGASQVIIEDDLDSHLTNVVIDSVTQPSKCTPSGTPVVLTCDMKGLGGSGSINLIVFHATVDPATPVGTVITNCPFELSSGSIDPDHSNDMAPHSCDGAGFTIVVNADMQVVKTQTDPLPASNPVLGGTNVTYHVVATNNGPNPAAGVTVGDSLTSGAALYEGIASVSAGLDCSSNTNVVGSPFVAFSCSATGGSDPLANGASLSFDLTLQVPNDGTPSITNKATTTTTTTDPDGTNDNSSVTTTICQSVDLSITKACQNFCPPAAARTSAIHTDTVCVQGDITTVMGGDNFVYHIVITNNDASVAATNVVLNDALPAGVTYVSQSVPCDTGTIPLNTCTFTSIAASGSVTLDIVVTAVDSGPIANTASVSADQCDRNTADNSSECDVTVSTNNQPVGLEADREDCGTDADCVSTLSDKNRVFEPNETARVDPSWKNTLDNADPDVKGTASLLTGPGDPVDATYTIVDSTADYGPIPAGGTADCQTATGDCYNFTILQNSPGTRPHNADHPRHWDATFHEALSSGETKDWELHLGDSFSDVARSNIFYRFVETIFHNHITVGCLGGVNYCPADNTTRQEMSAFISRSILLKDSNIPLVTADYDCSNPATPVAGQFVDISASNLFCKHANYLKTVKVTLGCFDSVHFCPLLDVSRGQMSVFIARAFKYKASLTPGPPTVDPDGDVPQWKQSTDLSREYNCTGSDQIDPDTTNTIPANTKPMSDVDTARSDCKHIGFLFTTTTKGDPTKFIIDGSNGTSSGVFLPDNNVRRDETSKFLANAFGDLPLYGPLTF